LNLIKIIKEAYTAGAEDARIVPYWEVFRYSESWKEYYNSVVKKQLEELKNE